MNVALQLRGRADSKVPDWNLVRAYPWLQTTFYARHPPQKVGKRNCKELETLAIALDHLQEGEFAQLGDTLMQRFKATIESITSETWAMAQHQELIPSEDVTLTNPTERRLLAKAEQQSQALKAALESGRRR